jgi:UDP-N-acetylmuramoyl-L-alanyl-D-glutamate--2,6-diaminopimelate ligase
MKKIRDLISKNIKIQQIIGDIDKPIAAVCFDTRMLVKNSLFVAQKGTQVDGHLFVNKAIEKGAVCIIVENMPSHLAEGITYIQTADSAHALGITASAFHDNPSEKLQLIGITGTNGKTTITTLLHQLFMDLGCQAGLLGTIENKIGDKIFPTTHTTENSVKINQLILQMVEKGCTYCFMEVSSHAIVQQRIAGLTFAGGIFSNITHEHLDYHKTFKEYIVAKKTFFDNLPMSAFALSNMDDPNGSIMLQNTQAQRKGYSMYLGNCDFKAKIRQCTLEGINLLMDNKDVWFRLTGKFNAYNLLAIYAAARLLGMDKEEVLCKMSMLLPAEGRFTTLHGQNITAIVDYAHTPDALLNVLNTIENLARENQDIVTVIGCGGGRDKTKRPQMAGIACKHSNRVILTSDNPRTENPQTILSDMETGIPDHLKNNVLIIEDRHQAIKTAITTASQGSIVLIAGKGHEKYQEIDGQRRHFDDIETVHKYLITK